MHRIGIASFTQRGAQLAARLEAAFAGECEFLRYSGSLRQWCQDCFAQADGIIFVGACGIAVRTIAPFLKSKTTDPAVLVVDEAGRFVISLLSGHIGGANEFTLEAAERIGAVPVITTASDVRGMFAVDVFARKNDLVISSMQDAKKIAAALLRGERVGLYCSGEISGAVPPELCLLKQGGSAGCGTRGDCPECDTESPPVQHLIWISERMPERGKVFCLTGLPGYGQTMFQEQTNFPERGQADSPEHGQTGFPVCGQADFPEQEEMGFSGRGQADSPVHGQTAVRPDAEEHGTSTVLHLIPRAVTVGIGCRRGKTMEEIRGVVEELLAETGIPAGALCRAASIDLKKDEPGLLEFCEKYGIEFDTYSAEELERAEGIFQASEFVRTTTGVDNVCERAAVLAAGPGGRLIRGKFAKLGVTAALAVRRWRVSFEE